MTAEFTGERVVPGQVNPDLWNEHFARYAFASRLSRGRRVLDAGCGTGYGAAELARSALSVTAIDVSSEALNYAREQFSAPALRWVRASCTAIPFAEGSFDLISAFEVIEHLADWPRLLEEAKRVLAPGGQFVVSTPNRTFYAQTRHDSGPNPYHEHEFEFEEFRDVLESVFPHVSLFVEDHTEGVILRSTSSPTPAEACIEQTASAPHDSNFFLAVCGMTPLPGPPTLVYIPQTSNLLRERLNHIARLDGGEIRTKDGWLAEVQADHKTLLQLHSELKEQLEKSSRWAEELNHKFTAAGHRIVELQDELVEYQQAYEARVNDLETALEERTQWARQLEMQLNERTEELQKQTSELGRRVDLLHESEALLNERTEWAQSLDREREAFEAQLARMQASRWVKLGRVIGLGPEIGRS